MGFIANFKAKRAAKKAQAIYELEQNEWEQENRVLNAALDIFTSALKGEEPDDSSLAQKKGELVLWTGNAIYHEAGRTASTYVGGSSGFSIPLPAPWPHQSGPSPNFFHPFQTQIELISSLVFQTERKALA